MRWVRVQDGLKWWLGRVAKRRRGGKGCGEGPRVVEVGREVAQASSGVKWGGGVFEGRWGELGW